MDNSIFTTLEVVKTARPDMGTESYEKITFYVEDPGQLESITAQVEALPELSDGDFLVTADNSSVEAVTAPLQNMNRLVSLLILLAVVVGGIVLYLVLASRVRERMGESGILLSLGFSKGNILAQHLTEALLLAVLAFSCRSLSVAWSLRRQAISCWTAPLPPPVFPRPPLPLGTACLWPNRTSMPPNLKPRPA